MIELSEKYLNSEKDSLKPYLKELKKVLLPLKKIHSGHYHVRLDYWINELSIYCDNGLYARIYNNDIFDGGMKKYSNQEKDILKQAAEITEKAYNKAMDLRDQYVLEVVE